MRYHLLLALLFPGSLATAQTGLSVTPPRVYYTVGPGQSERQKITVSNVSKTSSLDLSISLNDWAYDKNGANNIYEAGKLPTSCASWVTVLPAEYFSIGPGESKEVEVQITPPAGLSRDSIPVHTAMLYVTQLNPVNDVTQKNENIKVSVRTGIKLYHRFPGSRNSNIEINNFSKNKDKQLVLNFSNNGNVWADGTVSCELLNRRTGVKTNLTEVVFYSLPGDNRDIHFQLPEMLDSGEYVASAMINYGDDTTVKLAELEFKNEPK